MQNIVILGAGFAGLRCALRLEKSLKKTKLQIDWSIILIDRNSYHTYTPALYEAASAYMWIGAGKGEKQSFEEMLGGSLCLPISQIFQGKNIIFVRQEATGIDFTSKTVLTSGGQIPFTYLVLAFGSESITFGIKGAETCCYGLKTLYDAFRIRRRIEEIFKNYQGGKLHISVVGGGATGVEIVAEISKYARHLAKDFHIDFAALSVSLLEAEEHILVGVADSQRRIVEKRLKTLGIEVRTGSRISEVEKTCVILEKGEKCPSDITIWAAGVKGPALFAKIPQLSRDKRGYVMVDEYLLVQHTKNIFVIGDSSLLTDAKSGVTAPKTAFIAEQQANLAAENTLRSIQGKNLLSYKISIPGYIISCGGKFAVTQLGGVTLSGFLGWMLKRLIDLKYFLSVLPFFKAYSLWLQELRMFTKND